MKTIFLVDDDEDDRYIFCDALKSRDASVTVVEFDNGIDFLKSIRDLDRQSCALVLLDINMPRMTGLEVLTTVRADPACRHLPVIVISTASSPEQAQQIKDQGGSGFFSKPHSADEMEAILDVIDSFVGTCKGVVKQNSAI